MILVEFFCVVDVVDVVVKNHCKDMTVVSEVTNASKTSDEKRH